MFQQAHKDKKFKLILKTNQKKSHKKIKVIIFGIQNLGEIIKQAGLNLNRYEKKYRPLGRWNSNVGTQTLPF